MTTGGAANRGAIFAAGTPNESELERYMTETFVPMMRPCVSRIGPTAHPRVRGIDSSIRSTAPLAANPVEDAFDQAEPEAVGVAQGHDGRARRGEAGRDGERRRLQARHGQHGEVVLHVEGTHGGRGSCRRPCAHGLEPFRLGQERLDTW